MNSSIVALVKSILPSRGWRALRRATNRLRWILKFQLLRQYGFPISQRPWRALRYILLDPEVESFSYELANKSELATFLARLLDADRDQIVRWMHEADTDPLLNRNRGFHWSVKRRQPLGNRLMWYPIVRAMRPRIIVEAGVHEGLGSEVLLRALEHNEAEGYPGKLISFDIHEDTGWLVAPSLRHNWEFVLDSSLTAIEPALRGREVDMFIHETPHNEQFVQSEMDAVLENAGPRVVVIDSSGLTCPTLRTYCRQFGAEHHYFLDEPHDHIVRSFGTGFAIFERTKIRASMPISRGPAAPVHPLPAPVRIATNLCAAMATLGEFASSALQTAAAI